jgi:hypothetical protein
VGFSGNKYRSRSPHMPLQKLTMANAIAIVSRDFFKTPPFILFDNAYKYIRLAVNFNQKDTIVV